MIIQICDAIDTNVYQLSLQEIHPLIAQRIECKLTKRFREADEIQQTLYESGVKVHDKLRQWRADSGVFEDMDQFVVIREIILKMCWKLMKNVNDTI